MSPPNLDMEGLLQTGGGFRTELGKTSASELHFLGGKVPSKQLAPHRGPGRLIAEQGTRNKSVKKRKIQKRIFPHLGGNGEKEAGVTVWSPQTAERKSLLARKEDGSTYQSATSTLTNCATPKR